MTICKADLSDRRGIVTTAEVNQDNIPATFLPYYDMNVVPSLPSQRQGRHPCQLTNDCVVDLRLERDTVEGAVDLGLGLACGPESIWDDTLEHRPGLAGFDFIAGPDRELESIGAKAVNYNQDRYRFFKNHG